MIYDYFKEKSKIKFKTKLIIISIIVFIFVLGTFIFDYKFQLIQYEEIGEQFVSVFKTNMYTSVITMLICFSFIFLCIVITNLIIFRKLKYFYKEEKIEPVKLPNYSLAFIIAIIGAVSAKDYLYQNALVFLKANFFYIKDPIFYKDIGYYLFQRPFLMSVVDFILGTWLVVILYTIGYYIVAFGVIFNAVNPQSLKRYGVYTHNLINIAIFFFIKAITFRLTAENILYSKHRDIIGANFTDVNIWLKFYTLAPFVLIGVVIVAVIFFLKKDIKNVLITILVYPGFWVTGLIIATIVQTWIGMNKLTKEKNYISYNMNFTKLAYNLSNTLIPSDKLQEREFDISDSLSKKMIEKNKDIINNLQLIDYITTLNAQRQLQSFRNYYQFFDTDIVKYDIEGQPTPVFIAAREIEKKNLANEKVYENLRFRYTHGYGIVMSPINKVDKDGQPDFIIKDIPLQYKKGAPKILKPQIYFGELTKDYVIVNAKDIKEIDYPEGEENKETVYEGKAGVKLTPLNRIIMSIKLKDPHMLVSNYITSNSKVLINRHIIARAKLIAPFLIIDNDPYIIVNKEGRLLWIIDGYAYSSYFPYSQFSVVTQQLPDSEQKYKINYIRNSVKIVIDAYDGTVKFYIVDRQDPVIKTFEQIYPDLFEKGPLPDDIANRIKYPEKLLKIQAEILKKYHMNDVTAFFNNEDPWEIATHLSGNKAKEIEPYYMLMRLPGSSQLELVLILPFTPAAENRTNMTGWLVARSDINNYGKIILYKFPKNTLVYGPMQVESFIDQDPEISKNISLWEQRGSRVIRGNLFVVPLEDEKESTILYVEPLYISSSNESAIPQVKKVIVSYLGKVVMDDTLDKALNKILTIAKSQNYTVSQGLVPNETLLHMAVKVFEEMKNYASANDWENFGKKMKELDAIMSEINKRKENLKE